MTEPDLSVPALNNALELLFTKARTHFAWQDRDVPDALLRRIYDIAKWGPTASNSNPMRIIFVRSKDAKEKLKPGLMAGNVEKTMAAPVTAILGFDTRFFDHLERLAPFAGQMHDIMAADEELAARCALRNGALQGAYFMIAARALGLDCGPMSGIDHSIIDDAFFPEGEIKSNFLLNLGYGDPSVLHPRLDRFEFDEVCSVM